MLLTLIGAALAQEVDAPESSVRILYTGHHRGVGSGVYPFFTLRQIRELDALLESDLTGVEVFNGTLAQEQWLLRAPDRRVASVLALLDGTPITCGIPGPVPALESDVDVAVLDRPGKAPLFDLLAERTLGEPADYVVRVCRNGSGASALLTGPSISEPDWDLEQFEFRTALKLSFSDGTEMTLTGQPVQEAARITAELITQKTPGTLYMDAGDFVDGASTVRPGTLSLYRPLGFQTLRRLDPDALAPGYAELILGARSFAEERGDLPYVATNWSAEDSALQLPAYRIVTAEGGERIGVVAVLDPDLMLRVPALAAEGVTITDPVEATQAVVDALFALPEPPDAIVALTTASAPVMEDLRRQLRGVDVLLGDPTFATLRIAERRVTMRRLSAAAKGAPLTLSMDGVTSTRLTFADGALAEVRTTPHLVRGEMPADPESRAQITRTRAETYPPLDVPLVPDLSGTQPLSQEVWESLVCEAVRSATEADTVLLRELPDFRTLPGPMTELQLLDHLGLLDTLVRYDVTGGNMTALMDRTYGVVPISCGATLSSKKARGRSIETERTYRVVTTDHTVDDAVISGILDGLKPKLLLDGPGSQPIRDEAGEPALLSQTVLTELRSVRDEGGGTEAVAEWLDAAPSAIPQLWLLRLRQLDLTLARFQGTENDAFSAVPETLATSPSSLTVSSASDVALETSSARLTADLRFTSSYAAQRVVGEEIAESADDWTLSTSGTLSGLALPAEGLVQWMPYSELLFDSEFTPTLDEDGSANLRQSDLMLAVGLSSKPWGALTNVRVGGFANQDMARLGEKPTEFGGKTTWLTSVKLSGLTWSTTGDAQIFASTADDDASDLRLKFTGETRLAMPLARFLSIDLYAQGFALKGRVPENDDLGFSWTLGSALDVSGMFEL